MKELELCGVIAFDGSIRNGLRLHPDGEHLVYPMGNKVTIRSLKTGKQAFLAGHGNLISALCISLRGNFLASGQVTHHGFKAMVIIWDYENRKMKGSYDMHKVRVEDVCFTQDERYLISLGGRDDGSIVVWDVLNGNPLCGTFASKEMSGSALTIAATRAPSPSFVTAGEGTFRVWLMDPKKRKLAGIDVKFGKIRRDVNCVVLDDKDEYIYCGTTSGDIVKARLNMSQTKDESVAYPIMIGCYSKIPRAAKAKKTRTTGAVYAGGVKNLLLLGHGEMIVGAGDGTVESIEIAESDAASGRNGSEKLLVLPCIVTHRTGHVGGTVTSMVSCKNHFILVGTSQCEIYEIQLASFRTRLIVTCHTSSIYGLAFPRDRSEIFATTGKHDIRVWRLETQKELLRITVPNFLCSNLCFNRNSAIIISAWDDGAIRGFALNGGNMLFAINRAHTKSVSAITITNDDCKIVSGGCDGQVRVWNAKSDTRQLLFVLKQHRGPITSLQVSSDDQHLISSSTDGTCIVWDARNFRRKLALQANTMHMATCFVPTGVQVLTCGTDRKIAYWETLDGSLVREVEGSTTGTVNAIAVDSSGRYFLTGSDDCIVKLWEYRTATVVGLGLAHAAPISGCAFSPDGEFMVTVSTDGGTMIWKRPIEPQTELNDAKLG
ncbi:cilia- and flagella-associated protein 52 isoform X2 [Nomia melanderi]|uniref:cilia- and flagella-associated protein 52 isoform X2 n=1 Tax=Nomia melanderi TaxID=2448451 RepID=UPI0013041217|nr:cilia- and flagella-associated protein 52 isoform X1 [Nomia melanderi]